MEIRGSISALICSRAHLSFWTSYGGDLRLAPTARRPPVVHVLLVEGGPLRPPFDVSRN